MIQGIGNNGIFFGKKRFKNTAVGIKTGRIQDGIFSAKELCNFSLQVLYADPLFRK